MLPSCSKSDDTENDLLQISISTQITITSYVPFNFVDHETDKRQIKEAPQTLWRKNNNKKKKLPSTSNQRV